MYIVKPYIHILHKTGSLLVLIGNFIAVLSNDIKLLSTDKTSKTFCQRHKELYDLYSCNWVRKSKIFHWNRDSGQLLAVSPLFTCRLIEPIYKNSQILIRFNLIFEDIW